MLKNNYVPLFRKINTINNTQMEFVIYNLFCRIKN